MSAAELLELAEAEGVLLVLDDGRLTWEADHKPPGELLEEIRSHKAEIIAHLTMRPIAPLPESLGEAEQTEQRPAPKARHTAATSSPEWLAARDAFHAHALGGCPDCYPPTRRYCPIGIALRGKYEDETLRKWNL